MGKLLPPVDITSPSQLNELDKRISIGPITLVMIYADWCGHCTRFKPMMEELENSSGRSVQVARVRDNVLPQSALANIPNEGYPSLMLIKKDGTAAPFLDRKVIRQTSFLSTQIWLKWRALFVMLERLKEFLF